MDKRTENRDTWTRKKRLGMPQGVEIKDAQIKGWTDKETKIRGAEVNSMSLGTDRQGDSHSSFALSINIH